MQAYSKERVSHVQYTIVDGDYIFLFLVCFYVFS